MGRPPSHLRATSEPAPKQTDPCPRAAGASPRGRSRRTPGGVPWAAVSPSTVQPPSGRAANDAVPASTSPGSASASERLHRLCAAVRAHGRLTLTEPEGLAAASILGFATPQLQLLPPAGGADGLPDLAKLEQGTLDAFPGAQLVVKVMSPTILHKSDVGGVAVVAREPRAVAEAIRTMAARIAPSARQGFVLEELVTHEQGLGGELLVAVRHTPAFGPVVALGPGGLEAELLGASTFPPLLLSPSLNGGDDPSALLPLLAAHPFTRLLTTPQRGRPPRIEAHALASLLVRLLDFASWGCPHPLAEIELNPVVLVPRGAVALDAVARTSDPAAPSERRPAPRPLAKIERLLAPRSIAVVGVSDRSSTGPGRLVVTNLLAAGFDPSRLWIVKEGRRELDGCPCVGSLAELPQTVDLLVVAVAAAQVPALVGEAVAQQRAESILLLSGGLGETTDSGERVAAIREQLAAARATAWQGPVLGGGNCLGVRSVPGRCNTLFIPEAKLAFPSGGPHPVALVTQSGAFAIARATHLPELDPRVLVTVGNQLDLTLGDYLTHLAADREIRVFGCYVEGFQPGDGARFLAATEALAASGRPVVVYLAGRTPAGARASASHTAAIAGDHRVASSLLRQAGALVATDLAAFDDLLRLAWRLADRPLAGLRLAAVSNAGFECVAMADASSGLTLAPFGRRAGEELHRLLAAHHLDGVVEVRNPLDLTPMLGDAGFAEAVGTCLADPEIDLAVIGCVPLTGALATLPAGPGHGEDLAASEAVAARLGALWQRTHKPWVVSVDAGPRYDAFADALSRGGIPVFRTADRALARLAEWASWRRAHPPS
jgi:acyl-CoA synthetase (NDP forming)